MKFSERFAKISEEIKESNADILSLCEVDHFDEYSKLLSGLGYNFYSESRRGKDSLVVAFKSAMFEYIEHYSVQHDDLVPMFDLV